MMMPSLAQAHSKLRLNDISVRIAPSVDMTILQNIDVGFQYTYQVQPAFVANLYTRVDRYTPQTVFNIPKVWTVVDPGAEIIYLREFPSEASALKARPDFDPRRIPLTANNALNMAPGEVVMLPVHLNLLVGPQGAWYQGPAEFYGRLQAVMRAVFQVQALRLADKRVRLRLIATRDYGAEAEAGIYLRLVPFAPNLVNKIFQGIYGKHVVSYEFDKGVRSLVMADYIFDLSNPDAYAAYNHLLSSDVMLTDTRLVNPVVNASKLTNVFVSDLGGVDKIASDDEAKPLEQRRIIQIFKGNSRGKDERGALNLAITRAFKFSRTTDLSQDNHITFIDSDNEEREFLAPTSMVDKHLKVLFGIRSEEQTRKASIITPLASHDADPTSMGDYVVSYEVKDKHLGVSETQRVLANLHRNIAPNVIDKLNLAPVLTAQAYKNARIFAQVIFNERSFSLLQGLSQGELAAGINKHLRDVRKAETGDADPDVDAWVSDRDHEVEKIAATLAESFNPALPVKERIRRFMDLQRGHFFRSVGTGCLMSMLPQDRLDQFVSVYIRVDAAAFPATIERHYGTTDYAGVVKASEFIENLLNNGAFDLRLETFGTVNAYNGQVISLKALSGQLLRQGPGH